MHPRLFDARVLVGPVSDCGGREGELGMVRVVILPEPCRSVDHGAGNGVVGGTAGEHLRDDVREGPEQSIDDQREHRDRGQHLEDAAERILVQKPFNPRQDRRRHYQIAERGVEARRELQPVPVRMQSDAQPRVKECDRGDQRRVHPFAPNGSNRNPDAQGPQHQPKAEPVNVHNDVSARMETTAVEPGEEGRLTTRRHHDTNRRGP
eukprot:2265177-Rhodomonas_salina.2